VHSQSSESANLTAAIDDDDPRDERFPLELVKTGVGLREAVVDDSL